jgi:hypothetical protein
MRLIHRMLTETEARQFAQHWVLAWNSHDLDAIMAHYGWEVVLTSPVAARLLNDESGTVAGKEVKKPCAVISSDGLKRTQASPSNFWM